MSPPGQCCSVSRSTDACCIASVFISVRPHAKELASHARVGFLYLRHCDAEAYAQTRLSDLERVHYCSRVCNYSVKPAANLMEFVEATDIQDTIKAGIFTRAEESLLWFAATHMSTFGEVTGKMDVVAHRYCQTVDYFAIRPTAA